jgi:glutamate synthase domain-containing protein 3
VRPGSDASGTGPEAILAVPELRDYDLINKELRRLLDAGATRVVLAGVEGQRLLVAGLRGSWSATIVVDGNAGPELAAALDAPHVTVVCRRGVADAVGTGLRAGRLVIGGNSGDGLGYAQRGGTMVARGDAGHRAGLMQAGGLLVVLGATGRLAAERQSGGLFVAHEGRVGPHEGRGRRGGRSLLIGADRALPAEVDEAIRLATALLV